MLSKYFTVTILVHFLSIFMSRKFACFYDGVSVSITCFVQLAISCMICYSVLGSCGDICVPTFHLVLLVIARNLFKKIYSIIY
jgi:hypothetical protein